ncbi:MAG: Methyl-accepting chemotaxis protein McpB [Candidatus Heimdallarchaeota archaeon LC_2]|nr:MAG: Methyl-accepting chemotaxis protein McpB [Candidatus Heimdallarchaeota archaeon LC_2]
MSGNGKIKSKGKGTKLSFIIGRGFGIIILLTLIVGAVSIIGIQNTNDEYSNFLDNANVINEVSMEMLIDVLKVRHVEKDFIATGNMTLIEVHDEYVNRVIVGADDIINIDINQGMSDLALEIKIDVIAYNNIADEQFGDYVERGGGVFGSSSGLIGELKVASDEMDDMIIADYAASSYNNTVMFQMQGLLSDIMQDEKNYLLSWNSGEGAQVHITSMTARITELLTIVDAQGLTALRETEWHNDWITYQSAFTAIVEIDTEMEQEQIIFSQSADELVRKIEEIEEEAMQIGIDTRKVVEKSVESILLLSIALVVVSILIGVTLTIWITRGIVKPVYEIEAEVELIGNGDLTSEFAFNKIPSSELMVLGDNVDNMKTSLISIIGSIAGANKILNAASEDLFSGAEEINASAEEVASTSQAMSNGATSQTELIAEVNDDIQTLIQMVEEIIKKIQTNTSDVSQIALQTNILALNAGIEASRAGDYGRGFMVVAENVRKLSDQSKDAAEKIAMVADEIAENLQKSFNKISNSIVNIVSVSEETAASAEEVAAAAEEMTATVEELSSAAQELTTQAEESAKVIATFKIN